MERRVVQSARVLISNFLVELSSIMISRPDLAQPISGCEMVITAIDYRDLG